jgi:hypothetical protein
MYSSIVAYSVSKTCAVIAVEPNPVVLPNGSVRVDLRNAGCNQQCCTGKCQQACLNPVAMKVCPHFRCGQPTPGPTVPITCFVRGFAISTDGGSHFTQPLEGARDLWDPNCQGSMLTIPGQGLFFSNPHSDTVSTRTNMTLQRSIDGGKTWRQRAISPPNRHDAYSALTHVSEPDMIGLLWETGGALGPSSTPEMVINFVKVSTEIKTDDTSRLTAPTQPLVAPPSASTAHYRQQALTQEESVIGIGSSDLAPVNPKDHGAVGNCTRMQTTGPRCYVDDTIALQQAIDYAQITGRSLLIPAGIYAISKPLFVHCTGALELIHHNGPVYIEPKAYLCTGIEGKEWYHPLRISGEGKENTVIMATKPMKAVLTIGKSTNVSLGIHVEKLHLHANYLADHGLLAQGVVRSRFTYVAASEALKIGMKLQDGFILYVQDCDLVKNGIGLWLEANANGVEVSDCSLSNNEQIGVYIERGQQVSVARNMIEVRSICPIPPTPMRPCLLSPSVIIALLTLTLNLSQGNGGPGIFAYDTLALDCNSNYFEANCCGIYAKDAKSNPQPYTLLPPSPSPIANYSNARPIAVNADIVVSGLRPPYYGTGDPVRALRISGSRFDGGCGYQHGASGFGPGATWNPNATK